MTKDRQLSDRASDRLREQRPDSGDWFNRDFFEGHDIDVDYAGTGANWWRPAAWGALASWGNWGWSTPYYYDDSGYAYSVEYSEPYGTTSGVPVQTQPIQTQPVQAQPVQAPAQTAQTTATAEGDWLPLGVFAVGRDANAAAQTSRYIQLAINRSGEIAGVLYNSSTDQAHDLTGKVDTSSQKAYWSMADRTDSPIASTGIYNLTEDQTPISVHFSDGSDQTWTLLRLKQEQ
ncbi:MAG: hypothetical protein LLG04_04290 [Parachlamydia sp.]|nr:hypothetical protein [Parachlamydia sp.]